MAVTQVPSTNDRLIVEAEFPSLSPELVFDCWTKPELLCQWWPQEAEVDGRVGGMYHLSWPKMNWHLRGRYTSYEPGKWLAFTWRWDHDEEGTATREVELLFEELAGGTRLMLTHGPYTDAVEDQNVRMEHPWEGWKYFLGRLQDLAR